MRDGSLLYCKKTYIHKDEFGSEEWITEGNCYKLVYDKDYKIFSIIDNQFEENNTLTIPNFLKEYFYTEQEYRKLKLEKINERR